MFYLRNSPPTVTLKDVAKEAEVSVATVSRVINGCKNVSTTTKSRVLAAIKTLDYAPNPYAIQLRSQRQTSPLCRKSISEKNAAGQHADHNNLEALRDQNRRLKRVMRALIRDVARWQSLAEEQVEGL
jgi:NAD+--asparagine ADP-ribosyltransferase